MIRWKKKNWKWD